MNLGRMIGSECMKLKHTIFGWIHMCMPLMGAVVFLSYYMLYEGEEPYRKWNLMLEIIAIFFPVLISVVVGIAVSVEEKNCNLQTLLSMPGRKRVLLAKLGVWYGVGMVAVAALFLILGMGISIKGSASIGLKYVVVAVAGLVLCNLFTYILHLFLQLKFGLGISLVWGVFECLQGILYSNVKVWGKWRMLPFSWSVCWVHDVLQGDVVVHLREWGINAGITAVTLLGMLQWFARWEGRKSGE